MKLNKETLDVLKNFATINDNLYIKAGNVIETVSAHSGIYAKATLPVTFPNDFGLNKVSKFLASLSLLEEPSLDFTENHQLILTSKDGETSMKLVTSPVETLVSPHDHKIRPKIDSLNMDNPIVSVDLGKETFEELMKGAHTLGVEDVSFIGQDGEVFAVAHSENRKSDRFIKKIGKTSASFSVDFKVKTLQVISGDYTIQINDAFHSKWTNRSFPLFYFIAANRSSRLS